MTMRDQDAIPSGVPTAPESGAQVRGAGRSGVGHEFVRHSLVACFLAHIEAPA